MKICIDCGNTIEAEGWRCSSCGFEPKSVGTWPSFAEGMLADAPKEFDATTYARMISFEERSFYCRARLKLIQWAITRFFPGFTSFFDFGAGTGIVLDGIRAIRPDVGLYASDLSVDSLSRVKDRLGGDVTAFHTDAQHIPYVDHFDVIGAFDVLEHIDEEETVLEAFRRAVKPGGGVVLTVPQHMVLWSHLDDETGHRRRYVGDELAVKVRDAGFEVALDTCFMGTLFLPQYVSRRWIVPRADGQTFEAEHMLPAPINKLLELVLSTELAAIRAGVRLRFGGMRIVAAHRT